MRESQIIRYELELTSMELLLLADGLEEHCSARHVHVKHGQLPIPRQHWFLFNLEAATFIQVPQQASQELNAVRKMSGHFR